MDRLVSISKAAKILGVSVMTLRRWDEDGRLVSIKTEGGHRRYDISKIRPELVRKFEFNEDRKTIAYARASNQMGKEDLENQKQVLELFCSKNGWQFEVISDNGTGVSCYKKGLTRLLEAIVDDRVGRLVITSKDRLLRFGAELVFSVCEAKGVEVVIINKDSEVDFEDDLAEDVHEIANVFAARLYGARHKKSRRLIENLSYAVDDASKAVNE